jgi:outer membrane protein assembly factor BamB
VEEEATMIVPIGARLAVPVLAAALLAACTQGGGVEPGQAGAGGGEEVELTEEWTWSASPPVSAGMPAVAGGEVAFTAARGRLVLLDAATGDQRWVAEHPRLRDVPPLLTADSVVAATEGGLASFDRGAGRLRWEADLGDRANTPVVAGGRVVTTLWDGAMVGVDAGSGREVWRLALPGDALGPPAGGGGTAVATWDDGSAAGAVAADAATGAERWRVPLPADGVSGPAVVASGPGPPSVVIVAGDVAAHGLHLDSGARRWHVEVEGAGSPEVPPLVLEGGDVLVAHRLGGVALVDVGAGRVRWSASSAGAAVRGGPAGPGPGGWFALPLVDGTILLAGPDREIELVQPPGLVSGVAAGPRGLLLVTTTQGPADGLAALSGW